MPGVCASCKNPQVREINRRIRADAPYEDISRWLASLGTPITRQALARHHRDHLGDVVARTDGRKPISGQFLETVRDLAHEGVVAGDIPVTLRDGLSAQKLLDDRAQRNVEKDLLLKISIALTGGSHLPRIVGPEVDVLEGEFRPLLEPGA